MKQINREKSKNLDPLLIILFFLPFHNWEREREKLWKDGGWENEMIQFYTLKQLSILSKNLLVATYYIQRFLLKSSLMHQTQLFSATLIFYVKFRLQNSCHQHHKLYWCPFITFIFSFSSLCWCIRRNFSRKPCNFNFLVLIIFIIQHLTSILTHTFPPPIYSLCP